MYKFTLSLFASYCGACGGNKSKNNNLPTTIAH